MQNEVNEAIVNGTALLIVEQPECISEEKGLYSTARRYSNV